MQSLPMGTEITFGVLALLMLCGIIASFYFRYGTNLTRVTMYKDEGGGSKWQLKDFMTDY